LTEAEGQTGWSADLPCYPFAILVSTVLDGKVKAGKSMEAHKGQERGAIRSIENII
jgi:hypothetical protein